MKLRGQPAPNAAAGAAPNAAAGAAPNVAAGAAPNPLGAVRNAAFAAPNADLQQIARQFGANQALNTLAQRASLRSRIMVRTLCTRYLAGHVTYYSWRVKLHVCVDMAKLHQWISTDVLNT